MGHYYILSQTFPSDDNDNENDNDNMMAMAMKMVISMMAIEMGAIISWMFSSTHLYVQT